MVLHHRSTIINVDAMGVGTHGKGRGRDYLPLFVREIEQPPRPVAFVKSASVQRSCESALICRWRSEPRPSQAGYGMPTARSSCESTRSSRVTERPPNRSCAADKVKWVVAPGGSRTRAYLSSTTTPMTPPLVSATREHALRYRGTLYGGQPSPWVFHH